MKKTTSPSSFKVHLEGQMVAKKSSGKKKSSGRKKSPVKRSSGKKKSPVRRSSGKKSSGKRKSGKKSSKPTASFIMKKRSVKRMKRSSGGKKVVFRK